MRTCKRHPTYRGQRQPRAECETCWMIWLIQELARLACRVQALEEFNHGSEGWF